ncbi:hypothetical protein TrRE_jg3113 [Triparma retinervis]|uniref:NADH-ubiquinone oxidoreductase 21kDa subunit N-terminal domain-containing protein n=1 Tax=Triparma retinervis TaxID=2557542 RepID=A0A9W7AXD1_9STRA|nr:hypothetical protein TrRE_jg3113 [Triparma retinervis]
MVSARDILDSAPYPTIFPSPTLNQCMSSARMSDYSLIGGVTFGSWAFGYVTGAPLRAPTAATAATIGASAAVLMVYQNTSQRLMGLRDNDKEVRKYM